MHYFRVHSRVVSAFVMREVSTRYGRSPGGYVWAFIEPIAFIAMMTLLMGTIGRHPPIGPSFILFYATGYLGFSLFRAMETYLTSSISANRSLMSYPVVAPIDAVIGRLILQGATSVVVTVIVMIGVLLTLRHPIAINWLPIIGATVCAWLLALGVSLTNIVLFFHFPIVQKVYQIVSRPLLLVSGVFYIPSMMPHPISDVLLLNPVTQIIMLFRTAFYGDSGAAGLDIEYLVTWVACAMAIGMVTFTLVDVARVREK